MSTERHTIEPGPGGVGFVVWDWQRDRCVPSCEVPGSGWARRVDAEHERDRLNEEEGR